MPEPQRFDFAANAWVRDDFLSRRTTELPAPETPPAPGRWVAPARTARISYARAAFAASLVAMPLALGSLAGAAGLALGLFFDAFLLVSFRNLPARPARLPAMPDDLRLMETSEDPDVCLVEVEITFDGRPVGTDRGVAWFEGGGLLFSGRRTSFAIGGEDVLPRSYWSEYGRERASALPNDAIPLRTLRPRTYLLLTPLDREEKIAREQAKRFLRRRLEFRERPAASSIPRQWPPFET